MGQVPINLLLEIIMAYGDPPAYGWAEIEGWAGPTTDNSWGICKDSPEGSVIKWAQKKGKAQCKGFEHVDGEIAAEPIRGKQIVAIYIPDFTAKAWKEFPALKWTEGPME